jgi:hemoglobin
VIDDFNLFQATGGTEGCRKLAMAFYARVAHDPVLRPLFPGKTLKCAIEAFSAFLVQFLGGPPEDTQRRWWLSLRESHSRFQIGTRERDAWMKNMNEALGEVAFEERVRSTLRTLFTTASAYVVNTGPAPVAREEAEPSTDGIHRETTRRWEAQLALDQAVAAIHRGAGDCAIRLVQDATLSANFAQNRSVFAALLASMMASGDPILLGYVQEKLLADPALAQERYSGRMLLHSAAGAGNADMVKLLLRLGAAADATDSGGHTPLYFLANECKERGAGVVRVLVEAGADVDAHGGVKRCTPLHMAARRGNREIAAALLDFGASLESKDSLGETPLRRAVNCDKLEVAGLLISRGADIHSRGSKGLTPLSAARSKAMMRLLLAPGS